MYYDIIVRIPSNLKFLIYDRLSHQRLPICTVGNKMLQCYLFLSLQASAHAGMAIRFHFVQADSMEMLKKSQPLENRLPHQKSGLVYNDSVNRYPGGTIVH